MMISEEIRRFYEMSLLNSQTQIGVKFDTKRRKIIAIFDNLKVLRWDPRNSSIKVFYEN